MSMDSLFKYGVVVDTDDNFDGDRVRVHIKGVDPQDYVVENIPYAFPLLPKTFYVKPKKGETVFVFSQDGLFNSDRFFMGPIISQPHKIGYDSISSQAFLDAGLISPDVAPSTDPENSGVQFNNEDVGIQGRGTTDIIAKPNEVRMRAGKSLDFKKLNKTNPSYVQIKHEPSDNKGSINIVSDDINLLSHKSLTKFNLNDKDDLISSKEYKEIIEKAHQLPFGDILVDFLKIFTKAFSTHVHAYAGLPPDLEQIENKKLLTYELDKILSKNIRIN